MLAVVVIIAAVCPGVSVSRTEIGWLKRAWRYARRIEAEIRVLAIRKLSYHMVSFLAVPPWLGMKYYDPNVSKNDSTNE